MVRREQDRSDRRGFTLVEMLVVVIMVGVLATLATFAVRKYIFSAKTSEAVSMITQIKAAEEAYRDETFTYLDVSGGYTDADLYPTGPNPPGMRKVMWGGGTGSIANRWRALGVQSDAPVQFGYAVVAEDAGQVLVDPPLPSGHTFGFANGSTSDPSYCVLAKGDVNGNGRFSFVVSHSFSTELYIENEGE